MTSMTEQKEEERSREQERDPPGHGLPFLACNSIGSANPLAMPFPFGLPLA